VIIFPRERKYQEINKLFLWVQKYLLLLFLQAFLQLMLQLQLLRHKLLWRRNCNSKRSKNLLCNTTNEWDFEQYFLKVIWILFEFILLLSKRISTGKRFYIMSRRTLFKLQFNNSAITLSKSENSNNNFTRIKIKKFSLCHLSLIHSILNSTRKAIVSLHLCIQIKRECRECSMEW